MRMGFDDLSEDSHKKVPSCFVPAEQIITDHPGQTPEVINRMGKGKWFTPSRWNVIDTRQSPHQTFFIVLIRIKFLKYPHVTLPQLLDRHVLRNDICIRL